MASLGSLPLLLEASSTTSSCALRRKGPSRPQPKRNVLYSNTAFKLRPFGPFGAVGAGKSSAGLGSVRRKKGVAAAAAGGSSGGVEEEEEEEEEVVADETLQGTIEQRKKIAERRKLVSSIKSSAVSTEWDTSDESDNSFTKMDQSSPRGGFETKYSSGTISDKSTDSADIKSVNPPISDRRKSFYEEKRIENSPAEHSIANALGLTSEASLGAAQSEILSPSILKVSEPYGDEDDQDLNKSDGEGVGVKHDATIVEGNESPLAGPNVMNVILVAVECAPWSKTGGLGDVAGALPKALARRGHRVMVVAPMYGDYSEAQDLGVRKRYKIDGQDMEVSYFHAYIDGVDFVFLESADFRHRGNNIYGGNRVDILKRMVLFCKAAVEVPWHAPCGGNCYGDGNLVFIANDWHTALLPVYLKAYYRDNGLMIYTRCVLVIHNIAHQGRGPLDDFRYLGLPGHYMDLFKLYDPMGGEHLNIFAAGLKAADRFVTVSHGYSWELKTSEGGWGLNGIINENDWKFRGIVNGIDTKDWNPKLDLHLKSDGYTNYSVDTLQTGKTQCKAALQRELGLPVRDNVPVIGFIGRLDYQKGVDLIAEAIPWIVSQDVQLVMLGTGRTDLEEMLRNFENRHRDKVRGLVCFSVKMSHRITAGADVLLMPSRFEPCGLNQLYAMAYGTVPVVHAVGGLRDTVHQFDPYSETGLGWAFERAEAGRLIDALGNCLNTYWNYKSSWEGLQKRGMTQDLSWDNAAQQYEEVLVAAKYHW